MNGRARDIAFSIYCGIVFAILCAMYVKIDHGMSVAIESQRDYVTLKWSDVDGSYTVFRAVNESKRDFAIRVVEEDAIMHKAFLSMKGK